MPEHKTEHRESSTSIPWQAVLEGWQAGEQEQWRELYTERGFASWWEWRESYVQELKLDRREWREEKVVHPHEVIPTLAVGGYKGWKKYRPAGKDVATFADLVIPPAPGELSYDSTPRVDVRTNQKVMDLVAHLRDTNFLVLRAGDFSVLLEGSHRAAAVAVEALDAAARSSFTAALRVCHFGDAERSLLEAFARDRQIVVKKKHE